MSNTLLPHKTLEQSLLELEDLEEEYQVLKNRREVIRQHIKALLIREGNADCLSVNWYRVSNLKF